MKQTTINKLIPVYFLVLSLVLLSAIPSGQAAAKAKPSLSKKKLTLRVGKSKKLKLKNNRKKVRWNSSEKKVATVSQSGVVRAKRKGTAKITAKAGKKKYVCRVTVKAKQPYAKTVLNLVNAEREKAGCDPLILDNDLCKAAKIRATEIVSKFSHTRPDGSSCFTVIKNIDLRYSSAAENIAAGQQTPEDVVESWMNSPGHRANILDSQFKKLGVGRARTNGIFTYYWVQLFASETIDPSEQMPTRPQPSVTSRPPAKQYPTIPPYPTTTPQLTARPQPTNTPYPTAIPHSPHLTARPQPTASPVTTTLPKDMRPDDTGCFMMLSQLGIPYNYCGGNNCSTN